MCFSSELLYTCASDNTVSNEFPKRNPQGSTASLYLCGPTGSIRWKSSNRSQPRLFCGHFLKMQSYWHYSVFPYRTCTASKRSNLAEGVCSWARPQHSSGNHIGMLPHPPPDLSVNSLQYKCLVDAMVHNWRGKALFSSRISFDKGKATYR